MICLNKETNKKSDNTNQFDAIKNLFSKSEEVKDENKNIDNKEIRKRKNSFMLKNKFTLDDMNREKIDNQIVNQIKAEENDNKENNNVIENNQGVVNNAKSKYKENNTQDINIENNRKNKEIIGNIIREINGENNESDNEEKRNKIKNVNESANINSKLDGKTINFETNSQDKIKNKNDNDTVRWDINSPEKNEKKGDLSDVLTQMIILKKKKKKPKKANLDHIDKGGNSSQIENKGKDKNEIEDIKEKDGDNKKEIDNPRIQQNEIIPTTTPNNKKKTIFAIIFGIIFVLSVVFLSLALAIEALNFLALVVSMAVVATIALVIVIVLAFIIYRDNKKSEPEGLAPTFSFDRNNDDKKITRCNSLDCLKMIETNKQFDPK